MQAEINFWHRPLLLESSQGIVYLLTVLDPRRERTLLGRAVHDWNSSDSSEAFSALPSRSEIYQRGGGRDLEGRGCLGGGEKGRHAQIVGALCQHRTRESMVAQLFERLLDGLVRSLLCAHVAGRRAEVERLSGCLG